MQISAIAIIDKAIRTKTPLTDDFSLNYAQWYLK